MARSARDRKLETRGARFKLTPGTRYWLPIGKGLALGYRRTKEGYGTWSVRLMASPGRYVLRALGVSDDQQESNGVDVLTFYEAQASARSVAAEAKSSTRGPAQVVTVKEAAEHYLVWYRQNRKGIAMAESAVRAHILPHLGDQKLSELTTSMMRKWLTMVATAPARLRTSALAKKMNHRPSAKTPAEKRARQSTANRILTVLKAILNKAHADGLGGDKAVWLTVKPYENVDQARIRFLTDAEAQRLVNSCPSDLRTLVRAALLTGARRGELAGLKVSDVSLKTQQIYVAESKSGKPRHIPLNPEGLRLFSEEIAGKTSDQLIFTRRDGSAWGHNYHVRALRAACQAAKVTPMVSFHELRHTYASYLANAGVDLLTISKLLGHSDTRITSKHYAHLADRTLALAVAKLPSFAPKRVKGLVSVK